MVISYVQMFKDDISYTGLSETGIFLSISEQYLLLVEKT